MTEGPSNTILTGGPGRGGFNRRRFIQGGSAVLGAAALTGGSALSRLQAAGIELPHKVREIENIWIPMSDGTRLAARLWIPEGAENNPVPCIFQYNPYHKRNRTRPNDDLKYPYYAGHGYACIRVDIRGAGDSEGKPQDEYVKQEQDDGLEIIAWLAEQPWCSGSVGMEGLSWSGFSSLQVAARRPPALKAIITHDSTDDRYADDAHYKGGCIIQDMFVWGSMWFTIQGLPGDPQIRGGDQWLDQWRDRIDHVDFNLGNWMQHQHRDAFWKHASVCEDYSQIECAVFAVGGWVDAYKNTVFRLLENLDGPRKGLVGPWGHSYPHVAEPGPTIDYLTEALRWWDQWLKGIDTGIMDEPMLRVWTQEKTAWIGDKHVDGRWSAEDEWPSPRIDNHRLFLNSDGLGRRAARENRVELNPLQTVGVAAGNWCPFDMDTELPMDQKVDDARSLTFNTEVLTEDMEILGRPVVTLELAVDKPVAFAAVRLNEVFPNGDVRRVTYGILNLTHRDSHEFPEALEPGKRYRIPVELDNCAHVFNRGSRIRVAVSTTYWPLILPSPDPVTLALYAGASRLDLPVRPARRADRDLHEFGEAIVPDIDVETLYSHPAVRTVTMDVTTGKQVFSHDSKGGSRLVKAVDTEVYSRFKVDYAIRDDDPTTATIDFGFTMGAVRGDWQPRVETAAYLSMTRDHFILEGGMKTFNDEVSVREREWKMEIPRVLV